MVYIFSVTRISGRLFVLASDQLQTIKNIPVVFHCDMDISYLSAIESDDLKHSFKNSAAF